MHMFRRSVLCCLALAFFVSLAYGQRFEVTPFAGARFGGTLELEQGSLPHYNSHIADSVSYGVSAGMRFIGDQGEGHDLVEFRWTRQDSHLYVKENALIPTPFGTSTSRPSIVLNHYFGELTHEFEVQEAPMIQPFVSAGFGAAHLSAPASSATRFAMTIGGGVKIFPARNWGFRIKAEYMPMVMNADVQSLVCSGGCILILNGGVMNQFEVSLGPAFRF